MILTFTEKEYHGDRARADTLLSLILILSISTLMEPDFAI
jgi:hypothetical protein